MPAFEPSVGAGRPAEAAAVVNGLYWLVAELAQSAHVVVAVDDVQWADSASLRFLLYLVRHLEGLAVLVLLAARSGVATPEASVLARLLAQPELDRLEPAPLSELGVRGILASELGIDPEPDFSAACLRATGGIPFLVHALATEVRLQGIEPTAESVRAIGEVVPDSVSHATILRLAGLHPDAAALARAVAVLGRDATLPRAARLAEIGPERAWAALDALASARILAAPPSLGFIHPILEAAVYRQLAPGERSRAHIRAAELLAAEGAADDVVARHLLLIQPSGRLDVIDRLRAAARAAQARGVPEAAPVYLRRALDEGPPRELRAEVLRDLGVAEKLVRDPAAVNHLEEARRLLDDQPARAAVALVLSDTLAFMGRWEEALEAVDRGLADAAGSDAGLALELEAASVNNALFDTVLVEEVDRRLPALRRAGAHHAAPPATLLVPAVVDVLRGDSVFGALELVERALDGGRLLAREGPSSWILTRALIALSFADELDRTERLLDEMEAAAGRDGSVFGLVVASGFRVYVYGRRGNLAATEDVLRRAFTVAREHELLLPVVFTLWYGADALVERAELADLAEQALDLQLPAVQLRTLTGAWLAELRARLLLGRGETARAVADLEACGEIVTRLRMQPAVSAWRSLLALALPSGDRARARRLVESELEAARRVGLARPIGVALRTLGLLEAGGAGIERLREAERVLAASPARLEQARTLVELGAALRRANQRVEAREPLRAGLDLAIRCGASRLVTHARTELVAAGARPRRLSLTGPESLTPTERRIAEMAASRMSNAAIAQALFVTTKSVENSLGRIYRKLAVTGRKELPAALQN
jgi:DNA-binding CsgD family transcriptional regulator